MKERAANPILLYLPLLTHADAGVRRHACSIMLATYGERSLTLLRRLLDDPEPEIQRQAALALQAASEATGLRVELRPFRGIYVECLGDLRVFVNGREIRPEDWAQYDGGRAGARKVQGLFAFLIHCGAQGATHEAIGDAIWGGSVSQSSLARTLSSLRQVVSRVGSPDIAERAISATRDLLRIDPAAYQTDAGTFERIFNQAYRAEMVDGLDTAVPLYQQARALYVGPYMSDIPRSSDWGQELRDLLMNDYVIATERLGEYEFAQHHFQRCVALCREGLEADPSADDLTCWALRSYAQLGMRVELDRTYQRYRAITSFGAATPSKEDDTVEALYLTLSKSLQSRPARAQRQS
jgi:DNA-binding SARP family transcriptional activator